MYRLKVPYSEADQARRFIARVIAPPPDHSLDVEWLEILEVPNPVHVAIQQALAASVATITPDQIGRREREIIDSANALNPPPSFITDRKNFEFWHIETEADVPIERPEMPDAQTVAFVEAERADAPTH